MGRRAFAGRVLFETDTRRGPFAWTLCGLATTALVITVIAATAGDGWHTAVVVVFALAAPLLAWIDLAEQRLPDLIVIPLFFGTALLTLVAASAEGTPGRALAAGAGVVAITVLFGVMFFVAPQSLGFGDVKLAPSVGLLLGWHGWATVVAGVMLIFVLGVVHGLIQAVRVRRLRGAEVAFGPAMITAPLLLCVLVSAP